MMKVERIYLKEEFPQLGADGCNAYVDCYIPEKMTEMQLNYEKRRCLVICPGGGYQMTSAREAEPIALNFLAEGYCAFVVYYSTKPHSFPQQLLEVAGAMEVIAKHQEEWACDIHNVAIMGFSAGGHLASQYANRHDCAEVRAVFPESKPVQKAVLAYPVITDDIAYSHKSSVDNYVGCDTEERNVQGRSSEMMVGPHTPPTFIWATADDNCVPVENSLIYAKALSAYKIPYELHIYPYGDHGLATADYQTCNVVSEQTKICHRWMTDCIRWLNY